MSKVKRRKKTLFPSIADAATVTLTSDEAAAMLSAVGVAIQYEEPPTRVAPHLARALEKFDVAFGFGITPKEDGDE